MHFLGELAFGRIECFNLIYFLRKGQVRQRCECYILKTSYVVFLSTIKMFCVHINDDNF